MARTIFASVACVIGLLATWVGTTAEARAAIEHASAVHCRVTDGELAALQSMRPGDADPTIVARRLERLLEHQRATRGATAPATVRTAQRLSLVLAWTGRWPEARELLQRTLEAQVQAFGPDDLRVAESQRVFGSRLRLHGEVRLASELLARSLAIYERAYGSDHPKVAEALNALAWAKLSLHQEEDAAQLAERALAINEVAPARTSRIRANSLIILGTARAFERNFGDAARLQVEAITLLRQQPIFLLLAAGMTQLGSALAGLGDYAAAKVCHESALAIREQLRAMPGVFISLGQAGHAALELGGYAEATRRYEEALAVRQRSESSEDLRFAAALENLALSRMRLNEHDVAKDMHERALELRERLLGPDHALVARSHRMIGQGLLRLGKEADAVASFRRASEIIVRRYGVDHWRTGLALNDLGVAAFLTGRYAEARFFHEKALAIYDRSIEPGDIQRAHTLGNLAAVLERLGEPADAFRARAHSLAILAIHAFPPEPSWRILAAHSEALRRANEPAAAILFAKKAVNAIQRIRGDIAELDDALQQAFLTDKLQVYRMLAELLVDEGRLLEASEVLRLLKEEEFREFTHRDAGVAGKEAQLPLSDLERQIAERIDGQLSAVVAAAKAVRQASAPSRASQRTSDDERRARLRQELAVANENFERFLAMLPHSLRSRARELRGTNAEQQNALHIALQTQPHAALLQYVVGPTHLSIIVTVPGRTWSVKRPVPEAVLYARIRVLRELIAGRSAVEAAAQALYQDLLAPIANELESTGVTTLLLSLDGPLRYIPFAVLHDGERFLIEKYAIASIPHFGSVGAGGVVNARAARIGGLGVTKGSARFNMKPLPAVRQELYGIIADGTRKGLISGEAHLDDAFTAMRLRELVAQGLPKLHIATHFQFRPGSERHSFLLLGNDSPLTLEEIRRMELPLHHIQLLTLSACQTAVSEGRNGNGIEINGLATMLANKGARNVVATLWQVADASTAHLMQEFYRQLLASAHGDIAHALRGAQLTLLHGQSTTSKSTDYSHPYFWAPFIVLHNS
jgi:CHAT domain-containing protein